MDVDDKCSSYRHEQHNLLLANALPRAAARSNDATVRHTAFRCLLTVFLHCLPLPFTAVLLPQMLPLQLLSQFAWCEVQLQAIQSMSQAGPQGKAGRFLVFRTVPFLL